jgi:hypothetical protein
LIAVRPDVIAGNGHEHCARCLFAVSMYFSFARGKASHNGNMSTTVPPIALAPPVTSRTFTTRASSIPVAQSSGRIPITRPRNPDRTVLKRRLDDARR